MNCLKCSTLSLSVLLRKKRNYFIGINKRFKIWRRSSCPYLLRNSTRYFVPILWPIWAKGPFRKNCSSNFLTSWRDFPASVWKQELMRHKILRQITKEYFKNLQFEPVLCFCWWLLCSLSPTAAFCSRELSELIPQIQNLEFGRFWWQCLITKNT